MANRKKPTNKEILQEINYIGNKVVDLHMLVRNLSNVVDLYLLYKKDTEKFSKFVTDKVKENTAKIKEAKKEEAKKEKPKV